MAGVSDKPHIDRVTPAAAIVGGEVVIHGRGFAANRHRPQVKFGDTSASVLVAADDFVVATVPGNAATGAVRVLRLVAAHDVGKAINPENCRQQVEGAMAMGLGYGLMEEYVWDKGNIANSIFLNYAVRTALDCPSLEIILVEVGHPGGPYGAKGMGEMASAATAPAIANAVYDACGVRIKELPLTATKILKVLRAKHQEKISLEGGSLRKR